MILDIHKTNNINHQYPYESNTKQLQYTNLWQTCHYWQKGSLGHKILVIQQLADPWTQFLKSRQRRIRCTFHHLSHTRRCTRLYPFVLLPHCFKQRLYKQSHHIPPTLPFQILPWKRPYWIAASIFHPRISIFQPFNNVGNDFSQMGSCQFTMAIT